MKKINERFGGISVELKKKAKKDYGVIVSARVSREVDDWINGLVKEFQSSKSDVVKQLLESFYKKNKGGNK
jgi:hypothetical protein